MISGEERRVHGLHARRTSKGAHEPVVDAIGVIDVHARQEPNRVAYQKFIHADDASRFRSRERKKKKATVSKRQTNITIYSRWQ